MAHSVALFATDFYQLDSNSGQSMSEECFNFQFTSLCLEIVRPIQLTATVCTKEDVK